MSLPGAGQGDETSVDETASVRLIRAAIDRGINYIDLGFPWDMAGHEPIIRVVGKALQEGYRQKVKVAVTVPAFSIRTPDDFDHLLARQLDWLGTEEVDFCLIGRLNRDNWPKVGNLGIIERMERAMADSRVEKIGFSFHDHYQILKTIVQAYQGWSLCSFQYSYMDVDHDPGTSGLRFATDQGLAVVVTEALRGGRLAKDPPEAVRHVWDQSARSWSPAEWALRFAWNQPGVSTVVCDMTTMTDLDQDVGIADEADIDGLSVMEEVTIGKVRDAFRRNRSVPCPSCRPCMPCPMGIDVPRFFEVYNDAVIYDDVETARGICFDEQIHPELCTECRICEGRCAKRLPIVDWLNRGREFLGFD